MIYHYSFEIYHYPNIFSITQKISIGLLTTKIDDERKSATWFMSNYIEENTDINQSSRNDWGILMNNSWKLYPQKDD